MARVSDTQIEQARKVDILDYLQLREPDNLKRSGPGRYCLADHDSLIISNGKWHWFSRGVGGASALDYLIKVRGMDFISAVTALSNRGVPSRDSPAVRDSAVKTTFHGDVREEKRPALDLPEKHWNNGRVTAYLLSRGIDREIIEQCIRRGTLYESKRGNDCVFVGYNPAGVPRYAAQRTTRGNFKLDVAGSEKRYGFALNAVVSGQSLCVCESPIDALSLATLHKEAEAPWRESHYLSLGGVSPRSAIQFLIDHPAVNRVYLCLDSDAAGQAGAEKVMEAIQNEPELQGRELRVKIKSPREGKDYNELLQMQRKAWREERKSASLAMAR